MVKPLRNIEDRTVDTASPDTAPPAPQTGGARLTRYKSNYSRFVWLMKLALPVVACVVLLLVAVWPDLKPTQERFPISVSDLKIETAGGQRVINARFTGVDSDNRPFSVTADSVVQEVDGTAGVKLTQPKADVTLAGDSWVAVAAPEGRFWRKKEVLELSGGVDLFHDEGYEFRTESARIDFRNGAARGDSPVHGQGPFGTIDAQGFQVVDSGDRILFTGKSRMVLFPGGARPGKPKGASK
jgi:lipopolysaccharide export system protein LptC